MSVAASNTNLLPLRFKEGLYRPLAYVRVKLDPAIAAAHGGVGGGAAVVPPAPPALTAPAKEYNTTLEKAVIELCDKAATEAAALSAAGESFAAVSASFKAGNSSSAGTSPSSAAVRGNDTKRQRTGPSPDVGRNAGNSAGASDSDDEPTVDGAHAGATMAVKGGSSSSSSSSSASAKPATGPATAGSASAAGQNKPTVTTGSSSSSAAARPGAATTAMPAPGSSGGSGASSASISGIAKPWACSICTFNNSPAASKCAMCENERPAPVATPSTASSSSSSSAAADALNPFGQRKPSFAGGSSNPTPAPAAQWYCSLCAAPNAASASRCHICSSAKQAGGSGV